MNFQFCLIPEASNDGEAEWSPGRFPSAELAMETAKRVAALKYPGDSVECVVVDVRTREAVLNEVVATPSAHRISKTRDADGRMVWTCVTCGDVYRAADQPRSRALVDAAKALFRWKSEHQPMVVVEAGE